MNKKAWLTVIGFVMFILGLLSIILALVGLRLSFLNFLYAFGGGFAILINLFMVFGGVVMIYLAQFDPEND